MLEQQLGALREHGYPESITLIIDMQGCGTLLFTYIWVSHLYTSFSDSLHKRRCWVLSFSCRCSPRVLSRHSGWVSLLLCWVVEMFYLLLNMTFFLFIYFLGAMLLLEKPWFKSGLWDLSKHWLNAAVWQHLPHNLSHWHATVSPGPKNLSSSRPGGPR